MTLEAETLRYRGGSGLDLRRRTSPAWRVIAFLVLLGFLMLLFGLAYVTSPRFTTVFLLGLFFVGLAFIGGQVVELRREVRRLQGEVEEWRARLPPEGAGEGGEGGKEERPAA